MNNKVIVMTAYKRPQYTYQVLWNLANRVGCRGYTIVIQSEPHEETREVITEFCTKSYMNIIHRKNPTLRGCGANTLEALSVGFELSDFVIALEDDVVPHKDFLDYMEWCAEHFKDDKSVLSVAAHVDGLPPPEKYYSVFREQMFSPWGWGTWKDRFVEMRDHWVQREHAMLSWDTHLRDEVRGDRTCIRPYLARTMNIGRDGGTWSKPEHFDKHYSDQKGVWSVDLSGGTYRED